MKNKIVLIVVLALLAAGVVMLWKMTSVDKASGVTDKLLGKWETVPTGGDVPMSLYFGNGSILIMNLVDPTVCQYEITPQQELIVRYSDESLTFEILQLTKDSLQLKMDYEVVQFVKTGLTRDNDPPAP